MSRPSEAYCVDSGHPVRYGYGDRCIKHGAADTPCFSALRDPRCEHPRWPRDANGGDRCPECGVIVRNAATTLKGETSDDNRD